MKKWLLMGVFFLTLALTACGLQLPFNKQYYRVNLAPDQWGFEVDNTGKITIVGNQAQVLSAPGAPEGVLDSVEVTYYDNNDHPVDVADPGFNASLPVPIPAGISCDQAPSSGASVASCNKGDADWKFDWAKSENFTFSLDAKIAQKILDAFTHDQPHLNWRAHVVFHAHTSGGQQVSWTQDTKIVFPLKSGG